MFKRLLSWIYGVFVMLRNLLYDEHLLYTYTPQLPTIAVGNLAVGGTGKTPHVEYIAALLLDAGYKVAILSRGYKRRTKGFMIADEHATAASIGDEPRQMQLKFPNAMVVVSENRASAISRLSRQFPELDVIILDDAFQHRKVRCGLQILLTPADNLYVNDHLLPYGRLREHAYGAHRADVVVVTKCPPSMQPIDRRVITSSLHCPTFQELCFSRVRYLAPQPVFSQNSQATAPQAADSPMLEKTSQAADSPMLGKTPQAVFPDTAPVLLLAGIATPAYFREYVGERIVAEMLFKDHHPYSAKDIARIAAQLEQLPAEAVVLTTEKDAVRLRDADIVPENLRSRMWYLPIEVDFSQDKNAFDSRVLRYVREHRRNTK